MDGALEVVDEKAFFPPYGKKAGLIPCGVYTITGLIDIGTA
jgi:hypothetical protein